MVYPNTHDTIVAVSSAWAPAPLGILRLSGPDALSVAGICCTDLDGAPLDAELASQTCHAVWIALPTAASEAHHSPRLPGRLVRFIAPRSYTGQDVVEMHTVGNPHLLRQLAQRLIDAGARPAEAGEFSARAYLNGKLPPDAIDEVYQRIHATSAAQLRLSLRHRGEDEAAARRALAERLTNLLARLEAGIDFVDEEDIRFIEGNEAGAELAALAQEVQRLSYTVWSDADTPHVTLVGLPNAGKSSLFNRLLGGARAIVSPVIGTTRDVLTARIAVSGTAIVLQDCAGLGYTPNELEAAAHRAASSAAERADLVLWVHDVSEPLSDNALTFLATLDPMRTLLVRNKCDRIPQTDDETPTAPIPDPHPDHFAGVADVSARTGAGLHDLERLIAEKVTTSGSGSSGASSDGAGNALSDNARLSAAAAGLQEAAAWIDQDPHLTQPELLAVHLHQILDHLVGIGQYARTDDLLGQIYSTFCVGK